MKSTLYTFLLVFILACTPKGGQEQESNDSQTTTQEQESNDNQKADQPQVEIPQEEVTEQPATSPAPTEETQEEQPKNQSTSKVQEDEPVQQSTTQETPTGQNPKQEVKQFSIKVFRSMFAKDCDTFRSYLMDPFLFVSEGFVEMDMFASEFCNEFSLINRAGVTFEEYLEHNSIDIYSVDELHAVLDENSKPLNFKEYLEEALAKRKTDFTFGENDYFVAGFRPKEGLDPINVNKDKLHFMVRRLANGQYKVSGVMN